MTLNNNVPESHEGFPPLEQKRLEDRIHALLRQAIDSTDPEEVETILVELRAALNEHIQKLRDMASAAGQEPRRRKTDP